VTVTEGVLVTGVYGTGKTSVCEELAELLESAGAAYCAIDLDWLTWFGIAGLDSAAVRRVELANIATVVNNYVEAGVKRFVLAGAVRSNVELAAMRAVMPFPLKAVRLTLSIEEIERRLAVAVTVGRSEMHAMRRGGWQKAWAPTLATWSSPTIGPLARSPKRSSTGFGGLDRDRRAHAPSTSL
jgi:hypothetical protein